MTDYKQLCADLLRELDHATHYDYQHALKDRAFAALAEPEPEGLTDDELFAVAEAYAEDNGLIGLHNAPDFARAVLARWGNHPGSPDSSTLQPVPVSERLPGPGDCDAEGLCWVWNTTAYTWGLFRLDLTVHSHWLPAHALPQPS